MSFSLAGEGGGFMQYTAMMGLREGHTKKPFHPATKNFFSDSNNSIILTCVTLSPSDLVHSSTNTHPHPSTHAHI